MTASAIPSATATAVTVTTNLAYEASNPWRTDGPELLDVYAPAGLTAMPTVVMFHGAPSVNSKTEFVGIARGVAELGFVVFVPSYGHNGKEAAPDFPRLSYSVSQVACAVAYAQMHTVEYGGDAAQMIVSGHGAGASLAGVLAFNRPPPTDGCPGGATLGPISALVTYDADWLAISPPWDPLIAADPRLFDLYTPWQHIAEQTGVTVALLTGELDGNYTRDLSDPAFAETFWAVRDPTGQHQQLARQLGLLDDDAFTLAEEETLAFSVLQDQGNPVTLEIMPGTSLDSLTPDGSAVLRSAFQRVLSEP